MGSLGIEAVGSFRALSSRCGMALPITNSLCDEEAGTCNTCSRYSFALHALCYERTISAPLIANHYNTPYKARPELKP